MGFTLDVTTGQRKCGGSQPNWTQTVSRNYIINFSHLETIFYHLFFCQLNCQRICNFWLHQGHRMSQLYQINWMMPILMSSSAAGMVVATGIVGSVSKGSSRGLRELRRQFDSGRNRRSRKGHSGHRDVPADAASTHYTRQCVRDPDSDLNPFDIPTLCAPGEFCNRSKGYRHILEDSCVEGEALLSYRG